ncbi:carbohydrate porin [Pseudomonas sp. MWU12-2323]|uniref:carbohydrate porin n=1 Tax=unclassified Pseudomonas TaxID=196821 RepID=UPI00137E2D91|nr:hypothetical protein [Pseudomonas sp. MWU12-2323]
MLGTAGRIWRNTCLPILTIGCVPWQSAWLTVRPNVQYIVHPGGTDHVDNVLVAGIKLQTKF